SYFEWAQAQQAYPWDDGLVAERLRQRMEHAFTVVWARAETLGVDMRTAAHVVAVEREADAIAARGLFPCPGGSGGPRPAPVRRPRGAYLRPPPGRAGAAPSPYIPHRERT